MTTSFVVDQALVFFTIPVTGNDNRRFVKGRGDLTSLHGTSHPQALRRSKVTIVHLGRLRVMLPRRFWAGWSFACFCGASDQVSRFGLPAADQLVREWSSERPVRVFGGAAAGASHPAVGEQ